MNSSRIAYFLFYREPKSPPLRCLALMTKCQPLHGVHPITLNKKEQYPQVVELSPEDVDHTNLWTEFCRARFKRKTRWIHFMDSEATLELHHLS